MINDTIIGVISEGHADRAVITNILKGVLGIDESNIRPLLPINKTDATDRSRIKGADEFGGWSSVKQECEAKTIINQFLALEGQDFIVIHLDTAEASDYGLRSIPPKDTNYAETLRELVVELVNEWLGDSDVIDCTIHAIAVEEIDAWLLTIYDDKNADSSKSADPKKRLGYLFRKNKINTTSNYNNYLKLSKLFSKRKEMLKYKFPERNASLKAFINDVINKVKVNECE